jgi:hypothetical protein
MIKGRHQLFLSLIIFVALSGVTLLAAVGDEENESVRYIGAVKTSNSDYKSGYHDGQMRPRTVVY